MSNFLARILSLAKASNYAFHYTNSIFIFRELQKVLKDSWHEVGYHISGHVLNKLSHEVIPIII